MSVLAGYAATLVAAEQVILKDILCEETHGVQKVGAAIGWDIDDDCDDVRREKAQEFIAALKKAVADSGFARVATGSLNVFDDPTLHKRKMMGIYGWVEVL